MANDFAAITVILIRHAERNDSDPNDRDPHLNQDGKRRARLLPHVLGKAAIKTVYTSHFIRTQETARPLLDANPDITTSQRDDAAAIKDDVLSNHAGQTVLVIGHSDSVPDLINQLGAGSAEIQEREFDNLFVVTVFGIGKAAVAKLKYGKPS